MAKFEFIFDDDHYRDIADLLIGLRDARAAWHAAEAGVHEWEIFSLEIRGGQRASAPLATLIDLAQTWAVGWWRRAHAEARARAKLHAPLKTRETLSEPLYVSNTYSDRNDLK
jgi:hypothetical protein